MGAITTMPDDKRKYKIGIAFGVGCMVIWGVLPIYWKALIPISSYVIILYRIVLAWLTCFLIGLKVYGLSEMIKPLKDKGTALKCLSCGILASSNWSIYIYAINSGQAIEASIGYFLQPLIVCIFGIIFFNERPTKFRFVALFFAFSGVFIVIAHFMRIPFIALMLGISFATYAAIKRHLKMKALLSLFCETIFIMPILFCMIVYAEVNGAGALATGQPYQLALLSLAGIFTATPLAMFAAAANRISMIPLGILGYIAPSITLYIGIFVFREDFNFVQFIAFVVIWIGLLFFTYGEIRQSMIK